SGSGSLAIEEGRHKSSGECQRDEREQAPERGGHVIEGHGHLLGRLVASPREHPRMGRIAVTKRGLAPQVFGARGCATGMKDGVAWTMTCGFSGKSQALPRQKAGILTTVARMPRRGRSVSVGHGSIDWPASRVIWNRDASSARTPTA